MGVLPTQPCPGQRYSPDQRAERDSGRKAKGQVQSWNLYASPTGPQLCILRKPNLPQPDPAKAWPPATPTHPLPVPPFPSPSRPDNTGCWAAKGSPSPGPALATVGAGVSPGKGILGPGQGEAAPVHGGLEIQAQSCSHDKCLRVTVHWRARSCRCVLGLHGPVCVLGTRRQLGAIRKKRAGVTAGKQSGF